MATAAGNQLYPLSTNDGQVIPLDIIRPLGLSVVAIPAIGATVTFPAAVGVCALFSTVDIVLDLTGVATGAEGDHANAVFVPARVMITAVFPDVLSLKALPVSAKAGILSVQSIQKWAGIGTLNQLVRN